MNDENTNQYQYELIKDRASEFLEDSVPLDAIPLSSETLPEEIIQTMQLEIILSVPEVVSETLPQIGANKEVSPQNDQEIKSQTESLVEQMEEKEEHVNQCDEEIAEERNFDGVGRRRNYFRSKEQKEQIN